MDEKKTNYEYQLITGQYRYHAFMLRCWAEKRDGKEIWRFSLEAKNRPRRGFTSLESLTEYLKNEFHIDSIE